MYWPSATLVSVASANSAVVARIGTRLRFNTAPTASGFIEGADCGRSDSPSAYPHVPSRLQIDHRHHRPEVGLDAGQQLRRIDFLSHQALSAHAELDARLVQFLQHGDVRVVDAVV